MERKPEWMRVRLSSTAHLNKVNNLLKQYNLNTVCQAANCPNRLECFSSKTATFMILGKECTRHCRFCNVTSNPPESLDVNEPENVAQAIKDLGLKHAVITSVTRDDLLDQGAEHFKKTVLAIRKHNPDTSIEVLTPDFNGVESLIKIVVESKPDVYNHNIETVKSLYEDVRPEADYDQSLEVIKTIKHLDPSMVTKSGIMLGLGETEDQVIQTLKDLRQAGCDIVTIGQYMQPSDQHVKMQRYIHPDEFKKYEDIAYELGFKAVASSPLVRSSYKALESLEVIENNAH
ncbi:lipoyl synthase [Acidaminobacter sp. JC074]|uniref:lipoyl synthase n=1 Tax=Acidaminobacter sp. JC074 TaxID=2530199 RepID=UPI001F0DD773|nr:lipoyl synthase [Acidaminobacter sp. JC074]MCH4888859.1 lipoyl synthase [Acidaminobacter sp. JC074]